MQRPPRLRAHSRTARAALLPSLPGLLGLLGALAGAAPCRLHAAEDSAIERSADPAQAIDVQIKVSVRGLVAEIRLRNTAQGPAGSRSFQPGPTLLRTGDGAARTATWHRLDAGTGNLIAAGAELILQLSADLPEPGTYETWIDTARPVAGQAAQPGRSVHVTVLREAASVPSDFVLDIEPMQQVRAPWSDVQRTMLIGLANTTAKPIEFLPPAIVSFSTRSGDATDVAAAAPPPVLDASGCASPLAPGLRCALRLVLGRGLSPGQYGVGVGVGGNAGGWSQKTATVYVRLPLTVAFVVTALGVGCGWLLQAWRTTGRQAFADLIELGLLRRRVDSIAAANRTIDIAASVHPILDAIDMLETRARSGSETAAETAALSDRVGHLSVMASVERAYQSLHPDAKLLLALPHARFAEQAAAAAAGPAPDSFAMVATCMVQQINNWPALAVACARADTQLAFFARLSALSAGNTAAESGGNALQTARQAALLCLPADAPRTAVADRQAALQAAIKQADAALPGAVQSSAAKLRDTLDAKRTRHDLPDEDRAAWVAAKAGLDGLAAITDVAGQVTRLDQLWHKMPAPERGTGLEAMSIPPAGTRALSADDLDLPVASAFGLRAGRPVAWLERRQRLLEWATNLIVLFAISLSGAALVSSNPAWGTPRDVISLLLTGLGSRVVIGVLGSAAQPPPASH